MRLEGELTTAVAMDLAIRLREELMVMPVIRLDVAADASIGLPVLQVLVAATHSGARLEVSDPGGALGRALARAGLEMEGGSHG